MSINDVTWNYKGGHTYVKHLFHSYRITSLLWRFISRKRNDSLLKKEKDNEYDKEAISVNLPGLGKIGYIANSPYTVLGESYSAGRLYDKISEEASGKVKFILDKGVICELIE